MKKNNFILIIFLTFTILSFSFQLTINAPKGALVYVNNQYTLTMKRTKEIIQLNKGTYNILISKYGYKDFKTSISIDSDKEITAELIPLASVIFHSNLNSFYIMFDNNKLLIHNSEILKIPININKVILSSKNYKSQEIELNLRPFETTDINVDFIPNGMITIESTPIANLYINNVFVGETPYSTILSLNKKYNLKLEKSGYLTLEKSISLKSDEPVNLKYELKKEFNCMLILHHKML
ncbi:PEGA domain-containing protein [Marinitoga lauensis]|uniref:PEGA domain-containing protein n=1 Tax=Marinitoga lauensis TaxID=2201189 RepID=UPI001011F1F0|nr:PEGA domain-containing protein [Marinitoga lauensis]